MKKKMIVLLLDPERYPMQWLIADSESNYCHYCFNKAGATPEMGYWRGEMTIAFRCSICGWLSLEFLYDHEKWVKANEEMPGDTFTAN